MEIKKIIIEALETDGSHHKQWYLEQIAKELGFDLNKIKKEEQERGYDWEEGIAPYQWEEIGRVSTRTLRTYAGISIGLDGGITKDGAEVSAG